ncbi:nucleotide disphospho-sugar-binding domain-containing protein [Chelatococcus reniformis]|uniref:nucleotide disphospho-sugar-binding domain-containing protein n=1 Tax=Chelatococcus reniformis TaxID=1494448 RepID=UPI00166DF7B2|nr:nucleotide disphospho-sugar-binding domain-containing protein [Chelatococcus reniformis]
MFRSSRRQTPRRPRALLAWELGSRGNVAILLGVAAHLRAAGIECLAALADTRHDQHFLPLGIRTVQTVAWPAARGADVAWTQRPVFGLTDRLANHGLADPASLAGAIGHYEALFGLFKPDVVVCASAFGGLLAAQGRMPVVACGTAQELPPIVAGVPVLFRGPAAVPSWPFPDVLDAINQGLALAGRFPLEQLGSVLAAEEVMPFGPDAFDIFAPWRSAPCLPAYAPGGLASRDADASESSVCLDGRIAATPQVVAGLIRMDGPVRAGIPGLPERERRLLGEGGAVIGDAPAPLPQLLRRSRVLVHHGGPELAGACLAAGVPQVILAQADEGHLTGAYVRDRGLGAYQDVALATTGWLVDCVRHARSDEIATACRAFAPTAQAWYGDDPALLVARTAARLAGITADLGGR